jgi:hypothetical protein
MAWMKRRRAPCRNRSKLAVSAATNPCPRPGGPGTRRELKAQTFSQAFLPNLRWGAVLLGSLTLTAEAQRPYAFFY